MWQRKKRVIQNVGRSVLCQSVSERCQRQGVRERPKAMDQGQTRLVETNAVHLFQNLLPNVYNMLGSFPGLGNTEVNEDGSIKGCFWGRLMRSPT